MDKLTMHSPDLTERNIERIAELFPDVITEQQDDEGKPVRAIDFDLLRQELSDHVIEGPQERYQLDWPGKRAALFAANAPLAKTLRPVREESVDFDTTRNLFIEGDNLKALKLLQESYLGKVNLIYIDPPYNTGSDLVYADTFAATSAAELERSGQVSEEGVPLIANTRANGRFHSDWLSMMYPRLKLARSLLAQDGVLFVSIDDTEVGNLRLILDEVFGSSNFVENYIWESNFRPDNSSRVERENAQHVLCYARSKRDLGPLVGAQKTTEGLPSLTKSSMKPSTLRFEPEWVEFEVPDGEYLAGDMGSGYVLNDDIRIVDGRADIPFSLTGKVIWSQDYLDKQASAGTTIVIKSVSFVPYSRKAETAALAPTTLIPRDIAKDVLAGNAEIMRLFGAPVFNHPKPTSLLKYLISTVMYDRNEGIVMDFFAGSGSTADAVLQLNSELDAGLQFIMIQLDESTSSDSVAERAGFSDIPTLARERIRRAATLLMNDLGLDSREVDIGFRALRVDTTNMADILRIPGALVQAELDLHSNSVKPDRSGEDLLFQVLLDWGLELTMRVDVLRIMNHEVFIVEHGALIACFDDVVGGDVVRDIASREPLRAVFRDSSFGSDDARINAEQIFAEISPSTDVKVI